MAGGPPCQSFSTGGRRAAISDPRGNLLLEYLRVVRDVQPRYFILENVPGLATAALRHRPISERPGKRWNLASYGGSSTESGALDPDETSGSVLRHLIGELAALPHLISVGVLNAADHGAAQKRLRFILVGVRGSSAGVALPGPAFGSAPNPWRTVRDAIGDLEASPGLHSTYSPEVARIFARVPPGGNWRDLPPEVSVLARTSSLRSGGNTGVYRRLSWDQPAPTVTGKPNRRATAMCHPEATRPLSVREMARLQGFPDSWEFRGSMSSQYGQVGNAVPVALGHALGRAILDHYHQRRLGESRPLKEQVSAALGVMRAASCNKRRETQLGLGL